MHKQHTTYRIFASFFAILLLFAPISQNLAYTNGIDQIKEVLETEKDSKQADKDADNQTYLHAASAIQAVIITGIHLNFDVVDYLYDFPKPVTPLKEFVQIPILPTQSGHIQNICAYYIAPHAP
ncbi:MAG: hypothetical protein ACPGJS_16460 [Flammeovirgaceae bacterium]